MNGLLLFISRKYPPAVGGMEKLSYRLHTEIGRQHALQVIAWGGSQTYLPVFVLTALGRALAVARQERVRLIHVGDPVLAPLGLLLKRLTHVPVCTTAHGLDVTYPNPLYQAMMQYCLRRLDGVVCISAYTQAVCRRWGIRAERCPVIWPGVDVPDSPALLTHTQSRAWLQAKLNVTIVDRPVIVSVGRLVERKGLLWFLREAMPRIRAELPEVLCLVCGDGPLRSQLSAEITRRGLQDHMRLLGKVSEEVLGHVYAAADVFVMPNVPVRDNPEGFGLVSLEARAAGTPVVVTNLEGISESVAAGMDGLVVAAEKGAEFAQAVVAVATGKAGLSGRDQIADRIRRELSWTVMASNYACFFDGIAPPGASSTS